MKPDDSNDADLNELVNALAEKFGEGNVPLTFDDSQFVDHRELAKSCLQTILSQGYEINSLSKPANPGQANATIGDDTLAQLQESAPVGLQESLTFWRQLSGEDFSGPAELYSDHW